MLIGVKSGCFTLLTAGHIKALNFASSKCDYLIVIINDDEYIKNKKGVIPIPADQRKIILESMWDVNEVYIYSGNNEHEWLKNFKEKELKNRFGISAKLILFHAQYMKNAYFIPGKNIVDKIIYIPDFECSSVSDIFRIIKNDSF